MKKKLFVLLIPILLIPITLFPRKENKELVSNTDNLVSFTVDGVESKTMPTKGSGYIANKITCKNGSIITFDNDNYIIEVEKLESEDACKIDFSKEIGSNTVTVTISDTSKIDSTSKTTTEGGKVVFYITGEPESITGGEYTLSSNKLIVNNVATHINLNITMTKKIYDQLLADKTTRLTRTNFNAFSTSNTKTLYKSIENNTTVYYFAGNATDNWVKFAGFYWRIIRTNSDKSIRLLFHGTSTTATDAYIAKTYFNSATKEDNYVGFMYGYVGTSGVNVADSQAKYSLDYFYSGEGAYNADSNKTFDTKPIDYADYISKSAIYCNDRSESSLTARDLRQLIGVPTDGDIYMATYRLIANKTPSYDCSQSDDKFTVNSYSGNGELDYPVGLMTADEIAFAGGVYVEELYDTTNILAYYYINSNGKNSSGDFWTMTPAFHRYEIGDSDAEANMFTVKSGKLGRSATNVYSSYVIRPVISIIGTTNWKSGDGSPSNPYELDI